MRKIYWDLENGVKKLNSDYEDIYFLLHVLYNAKTELYDRTLTDMRSRYDPTEAFINVYNKKWSDWYAINLYKKCDRWSMVACCDSYYFDGSTNSKMVFDNISKTWKINIRANLKNYDSEIEEFLDWLEPYIRTEGFIGYMRYEEWEDPTLIYNDFDNYKIVFKGVAATEAEQV